MKVSFVLLFLIHLAKYPMYSVAFAAPKKSVKSGSGFGKAPSHINLDDIAKKFPTRIPQNAENCSCPCGTGELYKNCCQPLHLKQKLPETPIDVLRSRYTAFSWRIIPYIMETTHPTCRDFRKDKIIWARDLNRDGMFDSYEFLSLTPGQMEISEEDANEAYLDFKVNLRANENNDKLKGQEITISERSCFLRDGDPPRWRYSSGEVRSDIKGLEDVKLNQ